MKKILAIALVLVMALTMFCGFTWNKQWLDMTFSFEKAVLCLPDGTIISGKVQSWTDYEDGDQIQVKIDGVTYLAHSSNVVLMHEG